MCWGSRTDRCRLEQMSSAMHKSLAAGRWSTLSIVEQLANVGSEVERTINAYESGKKERWENALARALELFDLTAADARWAGARRREVLRAREEFCRLFFAAPGDKIPADSAARQKKYFLQFAVARRR